MSQQQKAVEAEARASQWLAKANQQREAGRDDSKAIAKAEYWLAKANEFRGFH